MSRFGFGKKKEEKRHPLALAVVHKSVKNGQLKKRASYGRIDIYLQLP